MRGTLVIALLSVCLTLYAAEGEPDVEKVVRAAGALVKSKDYPGAIEILKSAIEATNDPKLYIALAEAYWAAKQKDDAVTSLEDGLAAIRQKRVETGKTSLRDNMLTQKILSLFKEYDPDGQELRDMQDEYVKKMVTYARRMLFRKQYRAAEKAITIIRESDPTNSELEKLIDGLAKQFASAGSKIAPGRMLGGVALDARMRTLEDDLKRANPEQKEFKYNLRREGNIFGIVLAGNPVMKDISPLAGIPFTRVTLSGSQVSDIGVLAGMPLTHLVIDDTKVADISVVKNMPLTDLAITGTGIKDLSPLVGHKTIATIHMNNCSVADLKPLATTRLRTLCANNTAIVDLGPIKNMTTLRVVYLEGTNITDIAPLKGNDIVSLGLFDCKKLNDLTPISEMKNLESLTIPGHCKNIEFLKRHNSIKLLANDVGLWPLIDRVKQTPAEFWQKFEAK